MFNLPQIGQPLAGFIPSHLLFIPFSKPLDPNPRPVMESPRLAKAAKERDWAAMEFVQTQAIAQMPPRVNYGVGTQLH